jgi:hypothetical protein
LKTPRRTPDTTETFPWQSGDARGALWTGYVATALDNRFNLFDGDIQDMPEQSVQLDEEDDALLALAHAIEDSDDKIHFTDDE